MTLLAFTTNKMCKFATKLYTTIIKFTITVFQAIKLYFISIYVPSIINLNVGEVKVTATDKFRLRSLIYDHSYS